MYSSLGNRRSSVKVMLFIFIFDSSIKYIYLVILLSHVSASLLISKDIELSPSNVLSIKSPGYPKVNYKKNTIYTWNVTAPAEVKEILIDIDMDIIRPSRGLCEDYLKVFFLIQ